LGARPGTSVPTTTSTCRRRPAAASIASISSVGLFDTTATANPAPRAASRISGMPSCTGITVAHRAFSCSMTSFSTSSAGASTPACASTMGQKSGIGYGK
jgi:hypothetical protein